VTRDRLEQLLARLPDARIAVVGDFFLDRYWDIDPDLAEVSLETGLAAHQIVAVRVYPGAAGTVTSNLRALGVGSVIALGVIGEDGEGFDLRRGLRSLGVDDSLLIACPGRFTPTYTKPMRCMECIDLSMRRTESIDFPMHSMECIDSSMHTAEMERFDTKNRTSLPEDVESDVIDNLRALSEDVDAIVVADQVQERNCGVIADRVREALAMLPGPAIVIADSRLRIGEFRGVHVKANRHEAAAAAGIGDADSPVWEDARAAGSALATRTGKTAFVTMGAEGVLICGRDGCVHVPGIRVEPPVDIVGAGDACMSGIISALCAGASDAEAGELGNLVASITITKLGVTGTATPDELLSAVSA
jgi:sugar/nucleoside kinase (ribokinase family)